MEIQFNILESETREVMLKNQFGDSSNNYWASDGETYVIHPKYYYDQQLKIVQIISN